jgi:hypothetical protein
MREEGRKEIRSERGKKAKVRVKVRVGEGGGVRAPNKGHSSKV